MSYYDDSSLFFSPNGYKASVLFAQKPMDANGQLTFTRASSATRVQSDGLIEKVRTNEIRNSTMVGASAPSTLPTNWTLTSGGLTFTVIGTGTEDGYTYLDVNASGTASANNARIGFAGTTQILGATGQYWTNSFYFKKISEASAPSLYALSILENTVAGTLVVSNVANFTPTTTLARYSYSILTAGGATVARVQPFVRFALTVTASYDFTFRIAATQMEQNDIATDYIPTTTAAVSVGPVSGLPRLDYLNSTCGKLLLEPQRTNDLQFSEQFDNAYWTKSAATVTANDAIAPDGTMSADKVTLTGVTGRVQRAVTLTDNANYTASVFVKNIDATNALVRLRATNKAGTTCEASFTLTGSGTISSLSNATATITAFPNDWYRCTLSFNAESGVTAPELRIILNAPAGFTTGESVLIWGAQLEAGAYASSYIPTLGASVTRVEDNTSKTSITSLIGQTEGTIFVEMDTQNISESVRIIEIGNGTSSNRIVIRLTSSVVNIIVTSSGVAQVGISSGTLTNGNYKIAFGYAANDFVLFINGTLRNSSASGSVPACPNLYLGYTPYTGSPLGGRISQALLFKTRLTNSELSQLTTL